MGRPRLAYLILRTVVRQGDIDAGPACACLRRQSESVQMRCHLGQTLLCGAHCPGFGASETLHLLFLCCNRNNYLKFLMLVRSTSPSCAGENYNSAVVLKISSLGSLQGTMVNIRLLKDLQSGLKGVKKIEEQNYSDDHCSLFPKLWCRVPLYYRFKCAIYSNLCCLIQGMTV